MLGVVNRFSLIIIVLNGIFANGKQTSPAIPKGLRDCYTSDINTANVPFSENLLVEMLQKIELYNKTYLNIREVVNSLLHSVVFDGVQKSQRNVGIGLPYRARGKEFFKYKLVVDYLVLGESQFPYEAMSRDELCFMHFMVSNTVEFSGDTNNVDIACSMKNNTMMPHGNSELFEDIDSVCPIKRGNIQTHWGSVSSGHLIYGLSSVLQSSITPFSTIMRAIGRHQQISQHQAELPNNANVLWVSTIAGDLAEVVLNQISPDPILGTEGFWNDSMLPLDFYLSKPDWDMSEAELLAGVDAVILSHHLGEWLNTQKSTRFSQLIEMYYSERGIGFNKAVKASNRSSSFQEILKLTNLTNQVIGTAKLLKEIGTFDVTLTENEIEALSHDVVDKFNHILDGILQRYDNITSIYDMQIKNNLEIVLVLDGTAMDYYKTQQFLHTLAKTTQVSRYGSKLGIINGETGNWMFNVSGELFQLFTDLNNLKDSWPSQLSLSRCLETLIAYYQNKALCSSNAKPEGLSVLIVSDSPRPSETEVTKIKNAIASIKLLLPDVRLGFILGAQGHKHLNEIEKEYENDFVVELGKDVNSLVVHIGEELRNTSAGIVRLHCNKSQQGVEFTVLDYVTPNVETVYEIHKEYLRRGTYRIKFIGSDYGLIEICAISSNSDAPKTCQVTTSTRREITFLSQEFCPLESDSSCSLKFTIKANESAYKCAEKDCRFPDQVRLDMTWTVNRSGSIALPNEAYLIASILLLTWYRR